MLHTHSFLFPHPYPTNRTQEMTKKQMGGHPKMITHSKYY